MIGGKSKLWIQIVSSVCLFFISDIGDDITARPLIKSCPILLGIIDNMIHAVIGALSWSVVDPSSVYPIPKMEFLIVILGSSFIDVDHFIAARSLQLNSVLKAPYRGLFHCSGFLLLITICLLPFNLNWSLILLICFIPHHLRDATRRGLYLYFPYVHSKPLSKFLVKCLLLCFPWIILLIRSNYINNNINYHKLNFSEQKEPFLSNNKDTFIV